MAVPTPFHNPRIPLSALTAATSFQNPPVLVLPIPPETAPDVELFIELNKLPTPILEDPLATPAPAPAPAPPNCNPPRATPCPSRRTNTPPPPGIPDGMDGMGSPHIPAHLDGFKHPLGGRSAFTLGFAFAGGDGEGRRAETSIPPPGFVRGIEMDEEWVQTRGWLGFILVPDLDPDPNPPPDPEYVVWQQSAAAAAAAAALGLFIAIGGADGAIEPEAGVKDGCK